MGTAAVGAAGVALTVGMAVVAALGVWVVGEDACGKVRCGLVGIALDAAEEADSRLG